MMKIEKIGAGAFKAKCLNLLDEVEKKHVQLIISKHGKPVARLVPVKEKKFSLYGCMRDSVSVQFDIVSGTNERWNADE